MTAIVYVGPSADGVAIDGHKVVRGVTVYDAPLWAQRGVPIDVDDDLAARLLEQPRNWQRAGGIDGELEERTWDPAVDGDGPLPPVPDSAYPPGAQPLEPLDPTDSAGITDTSPGDVAGDDKE